MKSLYFVSFASEYAIGYAELSSVRIRALFVGSLAKLMQFAITAWKSTKCAKRLARQLQTEVQTLLVKLGFVSADDPSKDVRYVATRSMERSYFRP